MVHIQVQTIQMKKRETKESCGEDIIMDRSECRNGTNILNWLIENFVIFNLRKFFAAIITFSVGKYLLRHTSSKRLLPTLFPSLLTIKDYCYCSSVYEMTYKISYSARINRSIPSASARIRAGRATYRKLAGA